MQPSELCELFDLWDALTIREFERAVLRRGWRKLPVSWKRVFVRGEVVMKFDDDGERGRDCHTTYEYRQWRYARPHKRRYLPRLIAYRNGLLFQERLARVCKGEVCNCGPKVAEIARRLRILDWGNHGYTADGRLKFFDSDSFGSGWWNWRRKKDK